MSNIRYSGWRRLRDRRRKYTMVPMEIRRASFVEAKTNILTQNVIIPRAT
jgi:hypothetical protein